MNEILEMVSSELLRTEFKPKTIDIYQDWTYRYLHFVSSLQNMDRELTLSDLSCSSGKSYLKSLINSGYAESTVVQARTVLIFVHKVLLNQQFSFKMVLSEGKKIVLRKEEVAELLSELPDELKIFLGLVYGTGMKVAECLNLRIMDINISQLEIKIRAENKNTQRIIGIPQRISNALELQMNYSREKFQNELKHRKNFLGVQIDIDEFSKNEMLQYLFPRKKLKAIYGKGMVQVEQNSSRFSKSIKRIAHARNLPGEITLGALRNSYAVHLCQIGCDHKLILQNMGQPNFRIPLSSTLGKICLISPMDDSIFRDF